MTIDLVYIKIGGDEDHRVTLDLGPDSDYEKLHRDTRRTPEVVMYKDQFFGLSEWSDVRAEYWQTPGVVVQ